MAFPVNFVAAVFVSQWNSSESTIATVQAHNHATNVFQFIKLKKLAQEAFSWLEQQSYEIYVHTQLEDGLIEIDVNFIIYLF